ncbi:uncharacterized protein DFL_001660 [Arthrobotrys flagrans]|uniref:Uncharacterized protein n=1 Tax=Arthrobotrys flagrans TaxID=97331 RepID=A0A437A8B7_ARTFL|nr:hypothetical protein DFL_001660 [Arthrobotrys flagrans]
MCTDYEIWYACGHKGHPVRSETSQLNGQETAVYANCEALSPTARVCKHCSLFQASGKVCQIQDRLVVTQRWDVVCFDNQDCKPIKRFDDSECRLLQKNLESSAIAGQKYLNSLSERERAELYKTSARISQPPVWGRKGPHIKKPRKVKTKEERERDREEKERARAQKEAEKAEKKEVAAARALTALASGKSRGGRKKSVKPVNLQGPVEKKNDKQKAEVIEVDAKPESTKRKKLAAATKVEPKSKAKAEDKKGTQSKGKRKAVNIEDQPSKPASKRQCKEKMA